MMRRPGVVVAIVFAVGALLGLGASSLFLDIDSLDLRAATEARLDEESGPVAALAAGVAAEGGLFEGAAEEIRDRQMRNLGLATLVAVVGAIGLGFTFGRWTGAGSPSSRPAEPLRARADYRSPGVR